MQSALLSVSCIPRSSILSAMSISMPDMPYFVLIVSQEFHTSPLYFILLILSIFLLYFLYLLPEVFLLPLCFSIRPPHFPLCTAAFSRQIFHFIPPPSAKVFHFYPLLLFRARSSTFSAPRFPPRSPPFPAASPAFVLSL